MHQCFLLKMIPADPLVVVLATGQIPMQARGKMKSHLKFFLPISGNRSSLAVKQRNFIPKRLIFLLFPAEY
jgi:hypothetical protein